MDSKKQSFLETGPNLNLNVVNGGTLAFFTNHFATGPGVLRNGKQFTERFAPAHKDVLTSLFGATEQVIRDEITTESALLAYRARPRVKKIEELLEINQT